MKNSFFIKAAIVITLINYITTPVFSQLKYDDLFTDHSLRIDYYHTGTHNSEQISLKELKKENLWSGTRNNLIYPFEYGAYFVKVYDIEKNEIIFSYGFNSLFEEWQFTEEAKSAVKGFPESLIIPFPRKPVRVELHSRNYENNIFSKIFEVEINPDNIFINQEQKYKAETRKIAGTSDHTNALDLTFIAEGYTQEEIEIFFEDVSKVAAYLFSISPFKDNQDKINIWAVGAISAESGTDIPSQNIWKSTALNTNFDTFGSDRYLTSSDFHTIRDYASLVPCDQVCVLVNTETYGGGGIFNFWNINTAKHKHFHEVFVHELGHSLGYLADEYYDSEVSTEEMHNKDTEPTQPNITTLVDFDSKWKHMLSPDTKIPTEISAENKKIVGVYEGGGYQTKGIYRPYINCKMRALGYPFCPVCRAAITKVIDYYSE